MSDNDTRQLNHTSVQNWVIGAVFLSIYFFSAKLGLKLDAASGFASLVWAPSGIALAGFLVFGSRFWPAVAAGAFLVNFSSGAPFLSACGIALGNTLEAVVGTQLLRRRGFQASFSHVSDATYFIVFAALLSTIVSASIGVFSLWAAGIVAPVQWGRTWLTWWVGDMLGILIVSPVILVWINRHVISRQVPKKKLSEVVSFVLAVVFISLSLFDVLPFVVIRKIPLSYMVLPIVMWSALRFGNRGAATTTFAIASFAVVATALGRGPFARETLFEGLKALHLFLGYIAVTALTLAAAVTERTKADRLAKEIEKRLAGEERHRAIISSSFDAFIAIDERGTILDWNPQAETTFGWQRDEIIGRSLAEKLIPESYRDAHRQGIERFLKTGKGKFIGKRLQLPALHSSGKTIPVELTVTPVKQSGGIIFSAFLHDISDRQRAEEFQKLQLSATRILVEAASTDEAFARTLETMCQSLGWDFGAIWCVANDELKVKHVWRSARSEEEEFESVSNTLSFARGQGLPGFVWEKQAPFYIEDVTIDSVFRRRFAAQRAGFHSAAAFPIFAGTEFIGVIEFFSRRVQEPDSKFLEIMGDIGTRIGMFIHRAQADEQLRKLNEELELRIDERTRDLQQRENEMNIIANALPVGVIYIDNKQRFRYVNSAYVSWLGVSRQTLLGSHIENTLGWEFYEKNRAIIEDTLAGSTTRKQIVIAGQDKERLVDFLGLPDLGPEGTVRGFIGLLTDVTDQKAVEAEKAFLIEASKIFASTLDYQTLLTNLVHMVVPKLADWCAIDMLDEQGRVVRLAVAHVEPKKIEWARKLHESYPPEPSASRGSYHVIRSGTSELYPDVSEEILVAAARDVEHLRMLRQTGMKSAMVVPIEARGNVYGAMTFVMAESGRRFSERELAFAEELGCRAGMSVYNARLYRDAKAANRMKDEFLATLSHELRTPLNSIIGWTELIRSEAISPEEFDEAIATIHRNARAQNQLINDLLDVSRIITGKLQIEPRPVNVDLVVANSVASLRLAAKSKGIKLNLLTEPSLETVLGDSDRLQQVVWNLLSNAIKFTPKGGIVSTMVRRTGSNVEIEVSDSGEGIDEKFLPHVFDRFRQQDSSSTRRHGGLGLGLAIVRHIVELHGGAVCVSSDGIGHGSKFLVTLPVANVGKPTAVKAHLSPPRQSLIQGASCKRGNLLDGTRILVVDDDKDTRALLRNVLGSQGADVCEAGSAGEAMCIARSYRPEIVVSDIGMPEEDGYSFIRRLRALAEQELAGAPAIALTAYARDEDKATALDAGYNEYLAKPVEPGVLLEAITRLVGRRHQFLH